MEPKYDVAFSFCAEDERIAVQINSILGGRLSTFLYLERQKEIAARDEEIAFAQVFRQDARAVVILFREKWGQTPWTRVEMDAIRNRAYESGYAFTILVPVTPTQVIPIWFPKTYLWVGYSRYGAAGVASVIESKVVELGGSIAEVSAETKAKVLGEKLAFEEKRRGILSDSSAVRAAEINYSELVEEIKGILLKIQSANDRFKFTYEESGRIKVVKICGYSLLLEWNCFFGNSLTDSYLEIEIYNENRIQNSHFYGREPRKLSSDKYQFDYGKSEEFGWSIKDRFYSKPLMAENIVDKLITMIGSQS